MNRSFQSIAALLVSLSGAMLAVTWIPGEAPRPAAHGSSSRKRAAAVVCGYVTSGAYAASRQPRPSKMPTADPQALNSISLPEIEPSDLARGRDFSAWTGQLLRTPAMKAVAAAFGSGLAPLWPLGKDCATAPVPQSNDERRRFEEEYAAAELAAAAPRKHWVGDAWHAGVSWLSGGIQSTGSKQAAAVTTKIRDQFVANYQKLIHDTGWQETVPPLIAHIRRQHDRLVLREALLIEMDRRFMKMPLDRDLPVPRRPRYHGPSRKIILAAAEALKLLSTTLNSAAESLEAVGRHDVAELHTPVENREEKR